MNNKELKNITKEINNYFSFPENYNNIKLSEELKEYLKNNNGTIKCFSGSKNGLSKVFSCICILENIEFTISDIEPCIFCDKFENKKLGFVFVLKYRDFAPVD